MSPYGLIARVALLGVGLVAWAGAAPRRVLILSGANNHDCRATTPVLKAVLEKWAATGTVSGAPASTPSP
jgi:hypothetical protein